MTNEQRLFAASAVAGQDGQKTLLALYNAGPKALKSYAKGLKEEGTAAEAAAIKEDTLAGALARLHASLDVLMIRNIEPFLKDAANALNGLLVAVQKGTGLIGRFIRLSKELASERRRRSQR